MIKNFNQFLFELDSSFSEVTIGDLKATIDIDIVEKIVKFFNEEPHIQKFAPINLPPVVYMNENDRGIASKIYEEIIEILEKNVPKYTTYIEYAKITAKITASILKRPRGSTTYQFYIEPFKGISKLVMMINHENERGIFVLKKDLENDFKGAVLGKKYNI